MGKARRTKKQKASAKHTFTISWSSGTKNELSDPIVKGQNKTLKKSGSAKFTGTKYAKKSAKDGLIVSIKRDVIKSLTLASLILGIEIVIYFAWNLR